MNDSALNIITCGCGALAEGLDFPRPELVVLSLQNPLLRCLAPAEELDAHWQSLVNWMQSIPNPQRRLDTLQIDYYEMFLRPGTDLFLYIHSWFPDEPGPAFLGRLQGFLQELDLTENPHWRSGSDHIALVLELVTHLSSTNNPSLYRLVEQYLRPRFPAFARQIGQQSPNDFYRVMSDIAQEVNHAMETLS